MKGTGYRIDTYCDFLRCNIMLSYISLSYPGLSRVSRDQKVEAGDYYHYPEASDQRPVSICFYNAFQYHFSIYLNHPDKPDDDRMEVGCRYGGDILM